MKVTGLGGPVLPEVWTTAKGSGEDEEAGVECGKGSTGEESSQVVIGGSR